MPPKAAAKSRGKAARAAETGTWVYKADLRKKGESECWVPFDDEAQRALEESFLAGRPSVRLSIKGKEYLINYKKMMQACLGDASLQRPVARQVQAAAAKPTAKRPAASASKQEPPAKRAKQDAQREQFAAVGEKVAPHAGGRVHFSGVLIHDEFVKDTFSVPFKDDEFSECVGVGRYPSNRKAFPRTIFLGFNSVAVDAGTRVVIYSGPNFEGKVLWDCVGPAVVVGKNWANMTGWALFEGGLPFKSILKGAWKTIFPPKVREFKSIDILLWEMGSLVITDGEAIPKRVNTVEEYSNLDNPRS